MKRSYSLPILITTLSLMAGGMSFSAEPKTEEVKPAGVEPKAEASPLLPPPTDVTDAAKVTTAVPEVTTPGAVGVQLLTEFWSKVYNPPYDFNTIDRLCTEDFILTTSGKDIVGRSAFKSWAKDFSGKIRDLRLTSLDLFPSADGTRVVSRWKVTGFNRGMFGTSPDGQRIEFTGIAIWEVRDGKLAHNWVERSAYELVQRLEKGKK